MPVKHKIIVTYTKDLSVEIPDVETLLLARERISKYKITCADWEFEIDNQNAKLAAIEALIMAFNKYKSNLKLSTTTMVVDLNKSEEQSFFGTHEILKSIGLCELAKSLKSISNLSRNEIANLR